MKLRYYEAFSVPDCFFSMMSEEMFESYKSFFESHLKFLKDFAPKESLKRGGVHHFVFALNDGEDKILGFRYFFYSLDMSECELFFLYVDPKERKKGVASSLVDLSISVAIGHGISKFKVKIVAPEAQGEGLIRLYKALSLAYCPPCSFEIYYGGKIVKLPSPDMR